MPLPLHLYKGAGHLFQPFARLFLDARLARGKEDGARLHERLGQPQRVRPDGQLVWFHGASVGETLSVLPLIDEIAKSQPVMLTSGTVTSAQLAVQRLPPNAFHQFVPLDTPAAARRFVGYWRPSLALFVESEIWPNLLGELHRDGIPTGIVNGRMSSRSFSNWSRLPQSAASLLAPLRICLAQSSDDAARYLTLGADAQTSGNLKFVGTPLPRDRDQEAAFLSGVMGRPILLFASTHPGEEALALDVHRTLRETIPQLLSVIVPRHPHRGAEIARLAAEHGEIAGRRSAEHLPAREDRIYIADTLGELGLFYSVATVAVIGGSLVPGIGGHNPVEAIQMGCPILSGSHVNNARHVYAELASAGAVVITEDAPALAMQAARLLASEKARATMVQAGKAVLSRHDGALAHTLDILKPFLKQAS